MNPLELHQSDKKENEYPFHVTLHLNARFQPMHRHELEDALQSVLEAKKLGTVDGGGTLQMPSGEIKSCDIELMLKDGEEDILQQLASIVERFGVPRGSALLWVSSQEISQEKPVGNQEGLALYLNGTKLPAQVYQTCDINYVIEQMETLMEGCGRLYSWWEGPENTALYFYGESYEKMLAAVDGFLKEYPLCQKCTISQIA